MFLKQNLMTEYAVFKLTCKAWTEVKIWVKHIENFGVLDFYFQ